MQKSSSVEACLRRRLLLVMNLMLAFLLLASSPARAYSLRPIDLAIGYTTVHESMTYKSTQCLKESPQADYVQCRDARLGNGKFKWSPAELLEGIKIDGKSVTVGELWNAVRWPDDPLGMFTRHRFRDYIDFAKAMRGMCEAAIERGQLADEPLALQCSSHFGAMQFMHAMASREGEPARDTVQKTMGWAKFLFAYARGKIQSSAPFCETLLRFGRVAADVSYVESFICKSGSADRTVGSFFDFAGHGNTARQNRVIAMGALLHMLQDSFSQSHTRRGRCERMNGSFSRISPERISQFYTYGGQVSDAHAEADFWPPVGGERPQGKPGACNHPVIAGAQVLLLLGRPGATPELLEEFLRKHVFGIRTEALATMPPAGTGDCFGIPKRPRQ